MKSCESKIIKWKSRPRLLHYALNHPNINVIEISRYENCLFGVLAKWKSMGKMVGVELVYANGPSLAVIKWLSPLKPTVILVPHVRVQLLSPWNSRNKASLQYIRYARVVYLSQVIDFSKTINLSELQYGLGKIRESQIDGITTILKTIKNLRQLKILRLFMYGVFHNWHIEVYLPPSLEFLDYHCALPPGKIVRVPF